MKKSFVFVALAAVIAMCATSCKKDESVLKFTATIERGSSKTSLNGWAGDARQVVWSDGDKIKVWGGELETPANLGYICNLTSGTGATTAEFEVATPDTRLNESTSFTAVYPVDAWNSTGQVYINPDQTFIPGNVYKYPMMAVSNNTELEFKNVCGIIEVKLPQVAGVTLTGMKILAGHQISGDYLVYWVNGEPSLSPMGGANGFDEIEVSFPHRISLSDETRPSVLVYLPAGNHPGFTIEFYTTDFTYTKITASATTSINVNRSKITTLDFSSAGEHINWQPLPIHRNYFSVSSTLQVDIASGNLIHGSDASGGNWFIAQNAWDVYGNFDYFTDLFHWSGTCGTNNYLGGLTQPSASNFVFQDWGYLVTPNAGTYTDYQSIDTRWRCLSEDEWNYLTNSDGNANSVRYRKCYYVWITDMHFTDMHRHEYNLGGILLLPDDWEHIEGHPTITSSYESDGDPFLKCQLTKADLKVCLEDGCAFIPNTGFAVEDNPVDLIQTGGNVVYLGYYYLDYPYALTFESSLHQNGTEQEHFAWSRTYVNLIAGNNPEILTWSELGIRNAVRLVRNAKYHDGTSWHYYDGFDPNQNTGAKGKRK